MSAQLEGVVRVAEVQTRRTAVKDRGGGTDWGAVPSHGTDLDVASSTYRPDTPIVEADVFDLVG